MRFQLTAVGLACVALLSACGGANEGRKAQFIGFVNPGPQTLPATAKALGVTSSSNLPVTVTSDTPTICSIVDGKVLPLSKGACLITALQVGNGNYLPARVQQAFDIAQGANTITFASPGDMNLYDAPPTLVATSTSGLAVSLTSSTPTICTFSGTTLTLVDGGTCEIVAKQDSNNDYVAAQQSVTFKVIDGSTIFVSGYGTGDSAGMTKDGGNIEYYSAFPPTTTVTAGTYTFTMAKESNVADFGGYYGFRFNAPVPNPVPAGFTPGVQIVDETMMKFKIMMNPEMVAANVTQPNTTELRVWLYLRHSNNGCDVQLEKWMSPELVAGVLKEQSIDLSTFTLRDCGIPDLTVATELHTYPIYKIEFNVDKINDQVPNEGTNIYTTSLTMGSVKFKK